MAHGTRKLKYVWLIHYYVNA